MKELNMMRFMMATMLMTLGSGSLLGQDMSAEQKEFLQDHTPSDAMIACLEAPSRTCALRASLQTAVDEKLGIERSKILAGLSRSFIELGQYDRASQTLAMALEEAESIGISFAVQIKIQELAPLQAYARNADTAFALAARISYPVARDRVYGEMAVNFARTGQATEGKKALAKVTNPRLARYQTIAFLEALADTVPGQTLEYLKAFEADYDDNNAFAERLTSYTRMAIIYHKLGDMDGFGRLKAMVEEGAGYAVSPGMRAQSAGHLANIALAEGSDEVSRHVYEAADWGARIYSPDERGRFAKIIVPLALKMEQGDSVARHVALFENHEEKADFLKVIAPAGHANSFVSAAVQQELDALGDIDSAYERDEIRLRLFKAAYKMQDVALLLGIVRAMEDDDNMARGLAETASLLPE